MPSPKVGLDACFDSTGAVTLLSSYSTVFSSVNGLVSNLARADGCYILGEFSVSLLLLLLLEFMSRSAVFSLVVYIGLLICYLRFFGSNIYALRSFGVIVPPEVFDTLTGERSSLSTFLYPVGDIYLSLVYDLEWSFF